MKIYGAYAIRVIHDRSEVFKRDLKKFQESIVKNNLIVCGHCSPNNFEDWVKIMELDEHRVGWNDREKRFTGLYSGVVGYINDTGNLAIKGVQGPVVIRGNNFTVVCGNCNEQVYIHTERRINEISSNRGQWIYREGTLQEINQLGSQGSVII